MVDIGLSYTQTSRSITIETMIKIHLRFGKFDVSPYIRMHSPYQQF